MFIFDKIKQCLNYKETIGYRYILYDLKKYVVNIYFIPDVMCLYHNSMNSISFVPIQLSFTNILNILIRRVLQHLTFGQNHFTEHNKFLRNERPKIGYIHYNLIYFIPFNWKYD